MSLYNILHGMNTTLALVLSPFLPVRFEEFPRYRDIFLDVTDCPKVAKGDIYVYTRMGAGNANCWGSDNDPCDCPACKAIAIIQHPTCTYHYDDDFDSTFRTFVITVDEVHRKDFETITTMCKIYEASKWYFDTLREIFKDKEKCLALINNLEKEPCQDSELLEKPNESD